MARRSLPPSDISPEAPAAETSAEAPTADIRLTGLLDEIEQEDTPEGLLKLARELQRQLLLRRQRNTPN